MEKLCPVIDKPFRLHRETWRANRKVCALRALTTLMFALNPPMLLNPSLPSSRTIFARSMQELLPREMQGSQKRKYLPFEEARLYARGLQLGQKRDWEKIRGELPNNIPKRPDVVYKTEGWAGFPDWLGYSRDKLAKKQVFLPFGDARQFACALNLSSHRDWVAWCDSGQRPTSLPSRPDRTYAEKGWVSWPDWLGYEEDRPSRGTFLPFEDALQYVRSLNLSNYDEWCAWCKSGQRPYEIPSHPEQVYKDNGWIDFKHFLGSRQFLSFEDAREYVRALKFENRGEFREWMKRGERPYYIPATPENVYRFEGWICWSDFLGTRPIRNFQDARMYVRALGLHNSTEYNKWCMSDARPPDIPAKPHIIYKDKGWFTWQDWLGPSHRPLRPGLFRADGTLDERFLIKPLRTGGSHRS